MSNIDKQNESLGSLPKSVVSGAGGFSEPPPPQARLTETSSDQAVDQTTALLSAGLKDAAKDDDLVAGSKAFGQLVIMRVEPEDPLRDVGRIADAETELVPVAELAIAALAEEPVLSQIVTFNVARFSGRVPRLRRARRMRDAFGSAYRTLDLIVRNYEDDINTDLRTMFQQTSGLIDHHPRFGERLGWLRDWVTRHGQRAAESRRKNALRDARRAEDGPEPLVTPTPAPVVTPTPAPTPAPAPVPVVAAPAPQGGLRLAPRAVAPRRTRRR